MNPRLLALKIIQQVIDDGKSLGTLSVIINRDIEAPDDRSLCRELVYGVVRWSERLDFIISRLLSKPLKAKDVDVYCLMLLGAYQILYTRIPDHAAVNETVKLIAKLKKPWARSLVNGVLRNLLREQESLLAESEKQETATYSHPQWLIDLIKSDWSDHWQAILAANNQQGAMSIRVNAQKNSRAAFKAMLLSREIVTYETEFAEYGLTLERPIDPRGLREFKQGMFSVQDQAAQLAAELLDVQAGMTVLDACAAPGGKTSAILERVSPIKLIALDVDKDRLQKVEQTLQRLGMSAQLTAADAADLTAWWDGVAFDRILLDAPCSGTGVIRRNPDIKIHRTLEDISRLVDNQRRLLQQLWTTLKVGGVLLYATCSILKKENQNQVADFLACHSDAELIPFDVEWGADVINGRQILTGEHGMDGFFYAGLRKLD